MAVRLPPPEPAAIHPVPGVRLGTAQAGIRKPGRWDLLVMSFVPGTTFAGVFTRNRFCAAPVAVCREHLRAGAGIRALLVNTGNANAGTGDEGLANARRSCEALAASLGLTPAQVLPFSTGVIMEPLPMDRLLAALPACVAAQTEAGWVAAANAIMTTDTVPKAASVRWESGGRTYTCTGIAKGSGMIHPDMATLLGFIATDAPLGADAAQRALSEATDRSFNCITVDGDTSTNDSLVLAATGVAGGPVLEEGTAGWDAFCQALGRVALQLAQACVRDGEGATKFVTLQIEGGRDLAECRRVGKAIAHSPLVKTAFFASDPNLGRILAAIGYSGVADLDVQTVTLYLDDVLVALRGGRAASYREEDAKRVMAKEEFLVRVLLGRGEASATLWTCDLSHDYVTINAEYRT